MPEPMAARPRPMGSAKLSADEVSILLSSSLGYERLLMMMLLAVFFVRKPQQDVNGAQQREHQRLNETRHECQENERHLEGNADRRVDERQGGDSQAAEREQEHVLAGDVSEKSQRQRHRPGDFADHVD